MQEYTPDQYNDIFYKLPQPLQDILAVTSTNNKVFAIAKKHNLQVDQTGILNDIVMHILLGIIATKDFLETLKKETSVDPQEATLIVNEINEEIFKPVRELMEKTFRGGAPYKPRTMATIDENDEEHLHLTKHDILREIENPPEAEVRKEPASELQEEASQDIPEISKTAEIEKYSEELQGNKIEMRKVDSEKPVDSLQFTVDSGQAKQDEEKLIAMPSAVKNIAEMKLSSITNMEQGIKINEQFTVDSLQKKEETSKPVIDPYREPIQ